MTASSRDCGQIRKSVQITQVSKLPLRRHVCGDWGQLDRTDTMANESALKTGLRLLSSYPLKSGEVLWIITEAVDTEFGGKPTHRELTTLLLPADY